MFLSCLSRPWLLSGSLLLAFVILLSPATSLAQRTSPTQVQVMAVGFDHLSQLYTAQAAQSDMFSVKKQAELAQLRAHLARFQPDLILVEAERKEQPHLDSLYAAYQAGSLPLTAIPYGRSERYQVGFALAKELHLPAPQGIDYFASTPQSLLSSGRNIDLFKRDLQALQATARPLRRLVQHDSLSVYDYIALMNQPQLIALSHRALLNTPAQVTGGTFATTGPAATAAGPVDTAYIGAHYISLFYNRNLKIYSNLLRTQQQRHAQRLLIIYGQNHIGALEELLGANPAYRVVPAASYLKTSATRYLKLKKSK